MSSSGLTPSSQPIGRAPGRPKGTKKSTPVTCSCPDLGTQLITALKNPLVVEVLRSVLFPEMSRQINDKFQELEVKLESGMDKQLKDKFRELEEKIQPEMDKQLNDKVQILEGKIQLLSDQLADISNKQVTSTGAISTNGSSTVSTTALAVQKELDEKRRRASNVIVHGLAPCEATPDDELFDQFMENHLPVKPAVYEVNAADLEAKQLAKFSPSWSCSREQQELQMSWIVLVVSRKVCLGYTSTLI